MMMQPDEFPQWLQDVIAHLRRTATFELGPEEMAERLHEALEIAEVRKYATDETRFIFRVSGATAEEIARIRSHLTAFENSIVDITT